MKRTIAIAIFISVFSSSAWSNDFITSFQVIHKITMAQAKTIEKAVAGAPKRVVHSAARRANGEIVVVDVWQSRADFERYRGLIEPAFHRLGLPVKFDVIPTMNLVVNGQVLLNDKASGVAK